MKRPLITILVPSIGRMDFLPEVRRCLASQTRRDYSVIVLDNASPAAAREFFARWADDETHVLVARSDERIPMFSNFNRGMRMVDTPFVTFFHDDDVYLPRFLEVLVSALEDHPRAAFAGSNFDFVDEKGEVTERRRWIKRTELWSGERYIAELVGRSRNPVPMPGLVFRRDAFGADGFDESLPIHFGDFVLLMRAAEQRGIVACAEPVVRIRRHGAQASAIPFSRTIALRTMLMHQYLDEYAARGTPARDVAGLRRRVALAHRVGMVWGWLSSGQASERQACLDALGTAPSDAAMRRALRWAELRGFRPQRVGERFARVARLAAETLRL